MGFESQPGREARENSPEKLLEEVERLRIPAIPDFKDRYTDYDADMERTERMEAFYSGTSEALQGKVAEALVLTTLAKGELSEFMQLRASNLYDDYFHGVDAVFDYKHGDTPALGTIDVTTYQKELDGTVPAYMKDPMAAEARPVGLDKKLERVKRYTDHLASFDSARARELAGWMRSGGLHEEHTRENEQYFKEAEQVILLKYYLTPESAPEPLRPSYVIGGPQAVVSIDTVFVNKALRGDKRAERMVRALSFLEFAYSVHMQHEYLERIVRERKDRNLLFDSHYAKVNAWYRILQQPQFDHVIKQYSHEFGRDPDFRKQLAYYMQTLEGVFKKK